MDQPGVVDAIIIGAGAAGLAAASELRANGRSVVVIEARSRVGGRIFTYRDPLVPVPIELGAEFLHGATPNTDTIIGRAELTAVDVVG
ncbi:MAG: FAD-dependent oxidoreductase, partial [Gemmatimonadales bacterium]